MPTATVDGLELYYEEHGRGEPLVLVPGFGTGAWIWYRQVAAFAPSTLTGGFFDRNAPFGNTGRNILTGPGQKNVDFSVVKFIPFTESVRGEFRTEFFNLFNWANFANPNSNISVPLTFGRVTQTSAGPRVIQFAFKLNF